MNSKERVITAINGERPDKVPLGFYLVDFDIIEKVIGRPTYVRNNVRSELGFAQGLRDEIVESYKLDTVEFYKKIDIADIITFKEAPLVPPKGWMPIEYSKIGEETWQDAEGRVYKIAAISNDVVCIKDPVLDNKQYALSDFLDEVEDVIPDPTIFEACDYLIKNLGADRYIAGTACRTDSMILLGGMERGLMEFALRPEVVQAALRYHLIKNNLGDKYYIRPGQDGVLLEEDTGTTRGPLISPKMYREFCFPVLKERVSNIKKRGVQVLLHNCGNNRVLMPQFIEAGIQCYESLQTNADMEIESLKAELGNRLALWGGVPVDLLILGTKDEVRKSVRKALEIGAPDGGFILGPSHSIAYGTKYDNFMAMIDEFDHLRDKY